MKYRLLYYRVSTIAHATEDLKKVTTALLNLFPPDMRRDIHIQVINAKGHWGNPITIIEGRVSGAAKSIKAAKWFFSLLSDFDKRILSMNIRDHVDKTGTLYVRVNKQDAYLGRIVLDDGDDIIKIVIGVGGAKRIKDIKAVYRELGLTTP